MRVPYMIDRLNHRFQNQGKKLANFLPQTKPIEALPSWSTSAGKSFLQRGAGDSILPQVMYLVGETQVVMGTDVPTATGSVSPPAILKSAMT